MKLSKSNTFECASETICNQEGFLCKKCSTKFDFPNMNSSIGLQKSKKIDQEEEKEEETECYYCLKSNQMINQAVLLYKGKACCLQCKQSNIVNYIAAPDGKQRTIVTRRQESNQYNSVPTTSTHPSSQAFSNISKGTPQQYPSSTKNATNLVQQGGFFPSKFSNHQKHQSEMLPQKYENGNGVMENSNNFQIPQRDQQLQIHHSESVSQQYLNFNLEQSTEKNSQDNTPKHQKNSQTDPFVGRNYIQNKSGMFASNIDMMQSSPKSYIPIPDKPQIMFKDQKIETILREMLLKGQSYIQKKAVLSLMENRKNFTGQKFHDKLDKKKQILYVIILKSGFIFGGFHYISLKEQKDKSLDDGHSGLFSMQGNDFNFYPVGHNKIIYFDSGIWFGKPPSLIINFDMIDKCFCNQEFIFITPLGESQTISFGPTTKWTQIIQDICVVQF